MRSAENWLKRSGVAGLSVFADVAKPGENDDDVALRLVQAAALANIGLERNKNYYWTTAGKLLEQGFRFTKDEDDGELEEHFTIDLGKVDMDNVVRFLEAFRGPEATWRD